MQLTADSKNKITAEFDAVLEKLTAKISIADKLYFFSALHGTINRVLNFEFDPTYLFASMVLQNAYTGFHNRFQAGQREKGTLPKFEESFFQKLVAETQTLQQHILNDAKNEIYGDLERIMTLTYLTTGNGYYLYLKGLIKI